MATANDLIQKTLRLIRGQSNQYPNELMLDALNAAQEAILSWVPKRSVHSITGDGTKTNFTLPSDVYRIESVRSVTDGRIIPYASPSKAALSQSSFSANQDWLDSPSGEITFLVPVPDGDVYEISYLASWGYLAETTTVVEPPRYAHPALCYYAGAYALIPKAVTSSNIRQYAPRTDSGTPEDNPMADRAKFLMQLFEAEMSRMPTLYKQGR